MDALVADARCPYRHRSGCGHGLPLLLVAVANFQPVGVGVAAHTAG
jgi:hypothetical protein